jgi:hypothetical protein
MKVYESWDKALRDLVAAEIEYGEYVANPDVQKTLGGETWVVWKRINDKDDEVLSIGVFWGREEAIQHGEMQTWKDRWMKLKDALQKELAFEAGMFSDPKLRYTKLCEGKLSHDRSPIDMIWLHLQALHKSIEAFMWRLENGEDPMLEDMKNWMMEDFKDGLEKEI